MVQSLPQSDTFRILFNSPELSEVQRSGFHLFLKKGISEELSKISCIQLKHLNFFIEIVIDAPNFRLITPENSYRDCIYKMKSYTCKLYVQAKILFKDQRSGELLHETSPEWVLLGDLPIMTKRGHFVINGSPRVIVHQVGRAPGIYFKKVLKVKKEVNNRARFYGDIIPRKGVWVRLQINKKGEIDLKLKKSKKVRAEMVQKCLELLEKEEANRFRTKLRFVKASKPFSHPKKSFGVPDLFQRESRAVKAVLPELSRRSFADPGEVLNQNKIFFEPESSLDKPNLYLNNRKKKKDVLTNSQLKTGFKSIRPFSLNFKKPRFDLRSVTQTLTVTQTPFELQLKLPFQSLKQNKVLLSLCTKSGAQANNRKAHFVHTPIQSFFSVQTSFLTGVSIDNCFSSKTRQTQAFVTGLSINRVQRNGNPIWHHALPWLTTMQKKGSIQNKKVYQSEKILASSKRTFIQRNGSLLKEVTRSQLDVITKPYISKALTKTQLQLAMQVENSTVIRKDFIDISSLPLGAQIFEKVDSTLTPSEKEAFGDVYSSFYKNDIQDIEKRRSISFVDPSSKNTKQDLFNSSLLSGSQVSKKKKPKKQNVSLHFDKVRDYLYQLFKRSDLYDLSCVGRAKINSKFGISVVETQLTSLDIKETINWLSKLRAGKEEIDDIDHSQNRRIRTSSELIQNQFEIGISRLKNVITKKARNGKVEQIKNRALLSSNQFLLRKPTSFKHSIDPISSRYPRVQERGFFTKSESLQPFCKSKAFTTHSFEKRIKLKQNVALTPSKSVLLYLDDLHFKGGNSRFVKHNKTIEPRKAKLCKRKEDLRNRRTFTSINPYCVTYKEKKKYYADLSELKFASQKLDSRRNFFCLLKESSNLVHASLLQQTFHHLRFRKNRLTFVYKKGSSRGAYRKSLFFEKFGQSCTIPCTDRFKKDFYLFRGIKDCDTTSFFQSSGTKFSFAAYKSLFLSDVKAVSDKEKATSVCTEDISSKVPAQDAFDHPDVQNYKCNQTQFFQNSSSSTFSVSELFSTKPVNGALREFFSSNPLSQYMDQSNPLAEITHKRRISSLGVGGVSRESAGMAIRGIHPTHYGRICPIETPEGKNAGLVNSLAFYAKINNQGFIETPYYQVIKGQIQHELGFSFYSAGQESQNGLYIAPNDIKQSETKLLATNISTAESIPVRVADNLLDLFKKVSPYQVDCIGISPVQILSVATSLIPFLEHNDANRALMGSNMQRQAVSLMLSERAIVGTGLEARVLAESGHLVQSKVSGFVSRISAHQIVVEHLLRHDMGVKGMQTFSLSKDRFHQIEYEQSQNGCYKSDELKQNGYHLFKKLGVSQKGYTTSDYKRIISKSHSGSNKTLFCSGFTKKKSALSPVVHSISTFSRSNQETCLIQKPLVQEGDWVQRGDMLSDCSAGQKGELSVGKNMLIAYIPWQGYNFEDAIVVSDRLIKEQLYTSLHIERYTVIVNDFKDKVVDTNEWFTGDLPGVENSKRTHLQKSGLPIIGSILKEGDILVGKIKYSKKKPATPHEKLVCDILGEHNFSVQNASLYVPKGVHEARVLTYKIKKRFEKALKNNCRPAGAPKVVHIFLGEKRHIQVGDKMSGRHGNKGIVSTILPKQDMPYLADGSPIDIILNPLGVPSRMNVGQVFECLLGLASTYLQQNFKVTAFDELYGAEASQSLVFLKLYQARLQSGQNWLFQVHFPGKTRLTDGRSGECLDQWITVGRAYMLKLIHMVNEKIHARAIGPYALVTQQPLKGRAHKGGQRLGEMEVWAIEGFGAAYILQELLTKKSDDSVGRKDVLKAMLPKSASFLDSIDPFDQSSQRTHTLAFHDVWQSSALRATYSKKETRLHNESENVSVLGQPDIFKVLICELQALCLDVGVYSMKSESFQRQFLGILE